RPAPTISWPSSTSSPPSAPSGPRDNPPSRRFGLGSPLQMHAERHEGRLVRTKSTNRQRRRVANDAERPSPAPHLQRKTQLQRSRTRVSAERSAGAGTSMLRGGASTEPHSCE